MDCYDYGERVQDKLDSPLPWIGLYITAASIICSLAMAADLFHGFKTKMLWSPSRYFSLNATTLTLLAVAMKLPVDLTNIMAGTLDKVARVCSLSLMSAAMGNIIISLGSMDDNEILLNVTALGILVITVIVNVCVQLSQMTAFIYQVITLGEEVGASACLLISLANFCSSALTVPTTRRYMESKYHEMHKIVTGEETSMGEEKFAVDKLSLVVKKYYVMAVTGSAQFVMARSVICTTSGLVSVLILVTLVEVHVRTSVLYQEMDKLCSTYKWSINWIVIAQSIGVGVGTIAPAFRWFIAAYLKCFLLDRKSFKYCFKIETYWIQRLVDWRERPLPLQVRHHKWKKFLHAGRRLILNCGLGAQILLVLASKLGLLISASCFLPIKKLTLFARRAYNNTGGQEPSADEQLDLQRYVLLLPGEPGIPKMTVAKIWKEVDELIQIGKRQQPKNLIDLLCKSNDFNGVRDFDSNLVPSLHFQEPPNCWSLPIVTLTSIAISLPNIPSNDANQLVRSVSEGLSLLTLIEKSLDRNGTLAIIRDAADVVWVGVELYGKWLDKDLTKTSLHRRTSKEMLEEVSNEAERTVTEFHRAANDILMDNPLNWPVKIIAANSMYRISRTILLACDNYQIDDQRLFEYLTVVIADIFAACFTNLPHVITMKCHHSSIKEREKSVRQAALLLGETQEILEILQQRELPGLHPDKAAFIAEWRAFLEQDI